MRRRPEDETAAAARRRLEQLRAQLGLAALPVAPPEDGVAEDGSREGGPGAGGHGADAAPAVLPAAVPDLARVVVSGATLAGGPDLADDAAAVDAAAALRARQAGRHLRRSVPRTAQWGGWVSDRLPEAIRGRARLSGRDAALLGVLALACLAVAGFAVLRSGGGPGSPVPAGRSLLTPAPAHGSGLPTPGPAAGATPSATTQVVVDVTGRVRTPGVVRLPAGSRVIDALRRAGGARPGVDLGSLNLARVLVDGEQVVVGRAAAAAPGPPGGVAASAAAAAPGSGPLVDLNTATETELETLPGVGPVTAQKILTWRTAHGSFTNVDELMEIDGIGEKTLARLAPLVTL